MKKWRKKHHHWFVHQKTLEMIQVHCYYSWTWYPLISKYIGKLYPIYIYIPRTQMTSMFEGQPSKTRPFFKQNKGHLGSRYIFNHISLLGKKETHHTRRAICCFICFHILQGIVGCTPTNVPRHGKSLYKAYKNWYLWVSYPQESLGWTPRTLGVHVPLVPWYPGLCLVLCQGQKLKNTT